MKLITMGILGLVIMAFALLPAASAQAVYQGAIGGSAVGYPAITAPTGFDVTQTLSYVTGVGDCIVECTALFGNTCYMIMQTFGLCVSNLFAVCMTGNLGIIASQLLPALFGAINGGIIGIIMAFIACIPNCFLCIPTCEIGNVVAFISIIGFAMLAGVLEVFATSGIQYESARVPPTAYGY